MTDIEILSLYLPHNLMVYKDGWKDPMLLNAGGNGFRTGVIGIHTAVSIGVLPLLLPLSMLTEEIEHEGERFVPLEKLFRTLFPHNTFPNFMKHDVKFDADFIVWHGAGIASDYQQMTFEVIQFMAHHHVDFAGLIEQGKAIDKSKL